MSDAPNTETGAGEQDAAAISAARQEAARNRVERNAAQLDRDVILLAARKGVDPDAALRLIDTGQVTREDGRHVGVETAFDAMMERFPMLSPATKPKPSTGGPPAAPLESGAEPLTREDLKGKSAAWINENWDRVKAVL